MDVSLQPQADKVLSLLVIIMIKNINSIIIELGKTGVYLFFNSLIKNLYYSFNDLGQRKEVILAKFN